MSELIAGHVRPKSRTHGQKTSYFCKLCRQYGVKNKNAHLRNHHNAHPRIFEKRKDSDLLDAIFQECI